MKENLSNYKEENNRIINDLNKKYIESNILEEKEKSFVTSINEEDVENPSSSFWIPLVKKESSEIYDSDNYQETQNEVSFTVSEAISKMGFGLQQWQLLLMCGICWAADACEMMLLAFLLPAVQQEWKLSSFLTASIASIVFVGMLIGSPSWGILSDKHGRRIGFLFAIIFTGIFGLLSSMVPNIWLLLLVRGLVGFGIGGSHVAFSLFAEFLPLKNRGVSLIMIELFWTGGTVIEAGLAWLILPTLGWRWLLGLSTIPMFILLFFSPILPESPRFLLQKGKQKQAIIVLQNVAKKNKKELPPGKLINTRGDFSISYENKDFKYSFLKLLHPNYRKITLLLWLIWFINAFAYYGIVILTPDYFKGSKGETTLDVFLNTFITSLAEFPGLLISAFLVDKKKTQALFFILCSISTLLLIERKAPILFLTFIAVISRMSIASSWAVTYLYTPEVYPTLIRSTALGTCNAFSRIAAIITPYIVTLFQENEIWVPLSIYSFSALLAAIIVSFLSTQETYHQELK